MRVVSKTLTLTQALSLRNGGRKEPGNGAKPMQENLAYIHSRSNLYCTDGKGLKCICVYPTQTETYQNLYTVKEI